MSSLVLESTAIAPLEAVHLPDHLDGRNGTNREMGRAQISAQTDIDALKARAANWSGLENLDLAKDVTIGQSQNFKPLR